MRWTGRIEAPVTGSYQFQTVSDDGIRVSIDGVVIIENWTVNGAPTHTGPNINLVAGQRVSIVVEYFDNTKHAVARLRWRTPGTTSYVTVPREPQYPN